MGDALSHLDNLLDEYRSVPVDLGTTSVEEVNYWLSFHFS